MYILSPLSLTLYFRAMRITKGLTQQEAADMAHVRQKDVSAFENGRLDVRLSTLARLLSAVGIAVSLEDMSPRSRAESLRDRRPI
jgi:transcriptional regulator with XRE-family HTH domain